LPAGQTGNSFSICSSLYLQPPSLQSHFYVALDQKYVNQGTFDRIYQQAEKVGKMDSNLIAYLRECDRRYTETKKTKQTK
jgi:hypothetical protein